VLIADEFTGTLFRSRTTAWNWKEVFRESFKPAGFPARGTASKSAGVRAVESPDRVMEGCARTGNAVDAGNPPPSFGVFKSVDGGNHMEGLQTIP